jgi:uncharacterized membrane protein
VDSSGADVGTAVLLLLVAVALLMSAVAWWRRVVPYNRWVREHMARTAQPTQRWSEHLSRVAGSALMVGFAVALVLAAVAHLRGS